MVVVDGDTTIRPLRVYVVPARGRRVGWVATSDLLAESHVHHRGGRAPAPVTITGVAGVALHRALPMPSVGIVDLSPIVGASGGGCVTVLPVEEVQLRGRAHALIALAQDVGFSIWRGA